MLSHKDTYIKYCKAAEYVPIFHQPFWWDCVAPGWEAEVIVGDNTLALFPYLIEKKLGFSMVRNPHLTPYSGLLFESNNYSIEQKQFLYDKAIRTLKQLSLSEIDCNPQYCEGIISSKNKITFLLPLQATLENIFSNFKSSLRRQIRKAEKNLTVQEIENTNLFFEIYNDSISGKSTANKIPKDIIENVFGLCRDKKIGKLFAAVDHEGNTHAAIFYIEDKETAYYLLGGSRKENLGSGAMGLLLWHCIKFAHDRDKKIFDFEGSEDAGVARFFSTFGGTKTSYPVLSTPTNLALKVLLKLKKTFR